MSQRSARRRVRYSDTLRPVRGMMRMAIRTWVAGRGRHQRRSLFGCEVVGELPGSSYHGNGDFEGFPQPTVQIRTGRGKLAKRDAKPMTARWLRRTRISAII